MARQRETVGSIVEINLGQEMYAYAQILKGGYAFFDIITKKRVEKRDIYQFSSANILFIISVYKDVVTGGRWAKIGSLPIRKDLETLPHKFIQDQLNPDIFQLYNPNSGEIIDSTKEQCIGLERAAVWEAEHVEDRLRDYVKGRPNQLVERLQA